MAETNKELFISYGREPETVNFVRLLKRDLEKNGLTIWLDAEDISAGCDWYSAIDQGLENCKGIIAVITNKYINSQYCKSELYTANNDKKHIFPIIFEDVDFSSSAAAKGVKYIISGINWTMFRPGIDDYHTSLARLCQGMKEQGLGVPAEGGVAAETTTDALATKMGHLNVSGSDDAPPSAPPPHLSPHSHGGGYPQSPYPSYPPPAPYPSSPAPYPPGPLPPYQTTPPHPGYPQHPSAANYGYAQQQPNSNSYPQGYTMPPSTQYPGMYAPPTSMPPAPPTQHPGMYTPPTATPPAPPPQPQPTAYAEYTDGPPKYSDLYQGQPPPPPSAPQQTTYPLPPAKPLPEKPSIASDCGGPSKPTFSVGMKLEAVDRRFPYFVCVATIMDRKESEVLIHFDGWSSDYDYWCPPDIVELHPPGWCYRNSWELQTPRGQEWCGWDEYVSRMEADKAPEHLFTPGQVAGPGTLLFRAGMSVEAKDRKHPSLICAATIQRIGERGKLLIHFDGWSQDYDYWCKPSTTDIHPPMWCGKNSRKVTAPNGYMGNFKWSEYLASPGRIPAPAHLFTQEQLSANGDGRSGASGQGSSGAQLGKFQVGMKLEAKDRLHPTLVAVATIIDIRDKKLLIHFDGWTSKYDYWCKPTSADIHPVGWCAQHNKDLQPPKDILGGSFSWSSYLQQNSALAAPTAAFVSSQK